MDFLQENIKIEIPKGVFDIEVPKSVTPPPDPKYIVQQVNTYLQHHS